MASSFAPKIFPDVPSVAGVELATYALQGPYHPRDNLLVAHFPQGATLAGVTTQSSVVGAPVALARERLPHGKIDALIVNAGNANVCTGKIGTEHTHLITAALAEQLRCQKEHTFMASTGVIGEYLHPDVFLKAFPRLSFASIQNWQQAANAIMTTDTYPKAHFESITINQQTYTICGIAKGSGMIAPNMATMLAFIFTDLALPASSLQKFLNQSCPTTFNAISVDGDTSTSDMVLAIATGAATGSNGTACTLSGDCDDRIFSAFYKVCSQLALSIVRDGEGIRKLLKICVQRASQKDHARVFAKSIANSPLVKTAMAGEDLNWGRIAMALGKTSLPIDIEKITISFGGTPIYKKGQILYDNVKICEDHLKTKEITIGVDLDSGDHDFVFYSSDLNHDYIRINASYRS